MNRKIKGHMGEHRAADRKVPKLTPRLTIDRLDELFIKFWTLEGALTERGAAITIWRLKPLDQSNRFNYGRIYYKMAFYCQ